MQRFQTSDGSTSNSNKKKVRSETQFAIKTFPCYRCKCWYRKSKVSPFIIWYVLGPHAGEIWTKTYCPKCTKFWAFDKKNWVFLNHFRRKGWCHFKTFLLLKQVLNGKVLILRLLPSAFQKLGLSYMWNQVKCICQPT